MRLFERLFLGALALVLAIPCGAVLLGVGLLLDPDTRETLGRIGVAELIDLASGASPEMALAGLAQGLSVLLVVPPVLAALLGETLQVRALAWYGGASGLLTAALPWLVLPWLARGGRPGTGHGALVAEGRLTALLLVTGAASGFLYWLVAGRSAAARAVPGR